MDQSWHSEPAFTGVEYRPEYVVISWTYTIHSFIHSFISFKINSDKTHCRYRDRTISSLHSEMLESSLYRCQLRQYVHPSIFICWYDIVITLRYKRCSMSTRLKHLWLTVSKFTDIIYWENRRCRSIVTSYFEKVAYTYVEDIPHT